MGLRWMVIWGLLLVSNLANAGGIGPFLRGPLGKYLFAEMPQMQVISKEIIGTELRSAADLDTLILRLEEAKPGSFELEFRTRLEVIEAKNLVGNPRELRRVANRMLEFVDTHSSPPLDVADLGMSAEGAREAFVRSTIQAQMVEASHELPWVNRRIWGLMEKKISQKITANCESPTLCTPKSISIFVAEAVETAAAQNQMALHKAKGYSKIFGTMVATAAVSSKLISSLPENAKFLATLFTNISVLGVNIVGACIWDSLTSASKIWGFKQISTKAAGEAGSVMASNVVKEAGLTAELKRLDGIWAATNATYTNNAQVGRGVLNNFLGSLRQDLQSAYMAISMPQAGAPQRKYAITRLAMIAVRQRQLYAELSPADRWIVMELRSGLIDHVPGGAVDWEADFLKRIMELDPDASQPTALKFYQDLVRAWLQLG